MAITKAQFVDRVASKSGLSRKDAASAVDAVLSSIEESLKQGEAVMIFAEGTRSKGGEAQQARAGVVFLAQRTGVPIVPVAISGTEKVLRSRFPWYWRGRIQMTFGKPFYLRDLGEPTHHNRDQLAHAVMARVAALLPPAYQGIYAHQRKVEEAEA